MIKRFKEYLACRKEARIQRVWDNKTQAEIDTAYKDAHGWLDLEYNGFVLPATLREGCKMRLTKYIIPQMRKRWM